MKIKQVAVALFMLNIFVCQEAQAFYKPTNGKWLSRDLASIWWARSECMSQLIEDFVNSLQQKTNDLEIHCGFFI